MGGLGIIAGGGELPIAVARNARTSGRPVYLLGLRGAADDAIAEFEHDWISLGEVRRTFELLHEHGCRDVILCGRVARPRFSDMRPDAKGVLLLPKLVNAARKGDDALLRAVVDIFEREGFHAVGIAEAAPELIAQEGACGRFAPSKEDHKDIARAFRVVRALGRLDVGQAACVCGGLVLAVEAAEGTDAMIARIAQLPENIRGTSAAPRGVLVKALKPIQDRRTDLPVIGVETVRNVAAAGLRGIAIEAGNSLIIDRDAVVAMANAAAIFVYGFAPTIGTS